MSEFIELIDKYSHEVIDAFEVTGVTETYKQRMEESLIKRYGNEHFFLRRSKKSKLKPFDDLRKPTNLQTQIINKIRFLYADTPKAINPNRLTRQQLSCLTHEELIDSLVSASRYYYKGLEL